MDGADRTKPRPGVSKQDVCEQKANPVVPESLFCRVFIMQPSQGVEYGSGSIISQEQAEQRIS